MVTKLITTSSSSEPEVFLLTNQTTTIGRKPNNNITIDDLSVSDKHAHVITIVKDSFLEDLGSTNGTYVNGKQVRKHILEPGDTITFGTFQMTYQYSSASTDQSFQQTMIAGNIDISLPKEVFEEKFDESIQKNAAASDADTTVTNRMACLQLLSGTQAGKELVLEKTLTTIGKPGVQVAAITRRPQGFFIISVDGGPNNSVPKVAGAPIGSTAYELKNHDIIEVAGVKVEFYFK